MEPFAELSAGRVSREDPRREHRERVDVAAIQRQIRNLPVLDDSAECRVGRFDQLCSAGDCDRFGHLAELELDIQASLLLRGDRERLQDVSPEPFALCRDAVPSWRERGREVEAGLVGGCFDRYVAIDIRNFD